MQKERVPAFVWRAICGFHAERFSRFTRIFCLPRLIQVTQRRLDNDPANSLGNGWLWISKLNTTLFECSKRVFWSNFCRRTTKRVYSAVLPAIVPNDSDSSKVRFKSEESSPRSLCRGTRLDWGEGTTEESANSSHPIDETVRTSDSQVDTSLAFEWSECLGSEL